MKVQFTVTNQHIEAKTSAKIVADSRNYLEAVFFFVSPEWEKVAKTVVFSTKFGTYNVILDGDTCMVPPECIIAGEMEVSVFGGDRITTDVAKIKVFPSGYRKGETPPDPTPDVYSEILERLKTIQGGTVSEADIKAAVSAYMADNPVDTLTEDEVTALIAAYLTDHPQEVPDVSQAVQDYLTENPVQVDVSDDVSSYIETNKATLFPHDIEIKTGSITSADAFEVFKDRCYIFKDVTFPSAGGSGFKFVNDVVWVRSFGNLIDIRTTRLKRYLVDIVQSTKVLVNFREAPLIDTTPVGVSEGQTGTLNMEYGTVYRSVGAMGASVSVHIPNKPMDNDYLFAMVFEARSNDEAPIFYLGEDESKQLIPRIFGSIVAGQKYRAEYHSSDGVLRIM